MHGFTIETERLILRPLSIEDCDAVYKWVSDEDVARYMVYPTYTSKDNVLPRDDISVTKHGLKIPVDAVDYASFAVRMAAYEQEFTKAFA